MQKSRQDLAKKVCKKVASVYTKSKLEIYKELEVKLCKFWYAGNVAKTRQKSMQKEQGTSVETMQEW